MKCFGTVTNPVCIPSSQNRKGLPNAYLPLQHICALDISVPKSFRKYLKLNGGTGSSIQDPSCVCLIREIHNLARSWLSEVLSICKSVSEVVPVFATAKACIPLVFHIGLSKLASTSGD